MSRPAAFTQGDVSKLLKGARSAGLSVRSVEIDRSGKIIALFGEPEAAGSGNPWDEVLANGQEERPAKKRL